MAVHTIKMVQRISAPLEKVWDFFSVAGNLLQLTPPEMKMTVLSKDPMEAIFEGQLIEYKLRPLFGIPAYWKTLISKVEPGKMFVDEQKKGPYSLWRHEHHFKAIEGGVEMTDFVRYKNPMGVVGIFINSMIVRKRLREIFIYRFHKIEEIFGKWEGQELQIDIS